MKICMFTNTYRPHVGGVARSVESFSENLSDQKNTILVVAPEFEGTEKEKNESVLRIPAIQNFNGSDFSIGFPAPFLINDKMEEFSPDIIHSHHPFLLGDTALRVARSNNLPLVFTHHTLYEQYTHYVPMDSESMERFVIQLGTEYANFCTRIVAPSKSIADLIQKRGVKRPVDVVPTGVDIDFFSEGNANVFRKKHKIPKKAKVVGHLGRLAPEKNLDYLSKAVASFLSDSKDSRFLVVGDGPSKSKIRDIFKKKQIGDRVILPGEKSGQELVDAYKAMDIFVFASKSETQGMVLAEAMAAGKPVIALDASGSREVVNDNVNGRLLDSNTAEKEFAEAIAEFFDDNEKAEKWKEAAVETAKKFSRKKCTEKLIEVYQKASEEEHNKNALQNENELTPYHELMDKLGLEWDLISKKLDAVTDAIFENKK